LAVPAHSPARYTINRVAKSGGALAAVGSVTGTAVDSTGATVGSATQAVTVPLQAAGTMRHPAPSRSARSTSTCSGWSIHLDRVVLDITAEQGPVICSANLLCAVAGLLDPPTGGGGGGLSGLLQTASSGC
jgi:hypothetical protein